MTTRAVAAAAAVQPPAIYRLFTDKQGLVDAATTHVFAGYLQAKGQLPLTDDPVEDLRRGWDLHTGFGLAHPAVYAAIYGSPRPGQGTEAERRAAEILAGLVHRIAVSGRLAVPERAAAQLVHSVGRGTTLSLLSLPEAQRDLTVLELAREMVINAVTVERVRAGFEGAPLTSAAVTLRALLPQAGDLSSAERRLLAEWLDRLSAVS